MNGPLIGGCLILVLSIALAYRNWRRTQTWTVTEGTIYLRGINKRAENSFERMPVGERAKVRFADSKGYWCSFEINDKPGARVNEQRVKVLFDPNDSRKAMIATARDMYGWSCSLAILGAGAVLIGRHMS